MDLIESDLAADMAALLLAEIEAYLEKVAAFQELYGE